MSYFCHQCQEVKQQSKIQHCSEGIICRDCSSDFLEELNDQNYPSLVFDHHQPFSQRHHYQRHHPYSSTSSAGSAESASALDVAMGGADHLVGGGGHDPAPIRVRIGRGGSGSGGASAASASGLVGHGELDQLIQTLFQQVFGIVGDLDDYVMGLENLDDVVTQLMNQLDGGGPPPASPEDLRRVQSVPVSEQQLLDRLQCSVCFDEFQAGCETDRLPCQHHFHHDCIQPWLAKHGTCPVCRKNLAGEDTTTQAFGSPSASAAAAAPGRRSSAGSSGASSVTGVGGGSGTQSSSRRHAPQRRSLRRSAVTAAASGTSTAATAASSSRSRDRSGGGGGGGGSDSGGADGGSGVSGPTDE